MHKNQDVTLARGKRKGPGCRIISVILSFIMVFSLMVTVMPATKVKAAAIENYTGQSSFDNVDTDGTIKLTQNTERTTFDSGTTMLFVRRSCTLDGQSYTFTGNVGSKGNFLYAQNASIIFNLTNITLINSKCRILNPRQNGTVYNADSSVTFQTGTSPSVWGGGLAEIGGGATLNLNGSTVNGVKSSGDGGAFNITSGAIVNLDYTGTDHTITNCVSGGKGGVAKINNGGQLTIIDATIRNNSAKTSGGAIYLGSTGTLTLQGDTIITNNTAGESTDNIYLASDATITLNNFTGSAGITTEAVPTEGSPVKIATGAVEGDATRIISDKAGYFITFNSTDNCLYLNVHPYVAVVELINALPANTDVTTADKEAIEAARAAYDALSNDQKALIPADILKKLTDDEAALKDAEAIKAVSDKINALPAIADIKLTDKEAIEAARAAYDALSEAQKSKIPAEVLKKLTDSEAALAALENDDADTQQNADGTKTVTKEDKDGKTITVTLYDKQDKQIEQYIYEKAKGVNLDLKKVNNKNAKKIVVPATVKSKGKTYKVTRIRKGFIKDCKKVKTVEIGKNVKTIDKKAMQGGSKVKLVTIKGKLKKVGKNALKAIKKNATIKIQGNEKTFNKNKKLLEKSGLPKDVKIKRSKKKK